MRIESIERPKGARGRLRIELDDGSRIELSAEVAQRAGLRKGDLVDAADVAALERDDLAWRCKESALRLLSYRSRSERELRQRLGARGFPAPMVDGCLADLARVGLIDDARFADTLARERVRGKPVGKIRLRAELRAKGIDPRTVDQAIDEAMGEEPGGEVELARRASLKFRVRAGEDRRTARRRLYGYLARRGFPSEAVTAVVDERFPDHD